MQTRGIYDYIFFGTSLRFLQDAKEDWSINGAGWVLENIKTFLSSLKDFNLNVTQRAASDLEEFRDKIVKLDKDHKLTKSEADELKNIVRDIRKTLDAESQGILSYTVTEKRIDVEKLISDVSSLFGANVFESLSPIAKYDFHEAGKCIAFIRTTSAAFHLLRGTESVLRDFYCSIVKRGRVKPLLWGPMVIGLRNRKHPPESALLNNLDNIRENFRNPTQHPEKIYDIDEVQDLFGLCVDVVNRMSKLIKKNT